MIVSDTDTCGQSPGALAARIARMLYRPFQSWNQHPEHAYCQTARQVHCNGIEAFFFEPIEEPVQRVILSPFVCQEQAIPSAQQPLFLGYRGFSIDEVVVGISEVVA